MFTLRQKEIDRTLWPPADRHAVACAWLVPLLQSACSNGGNRVRNVSPQSKPAGLCKAGRL